MGLTLSEKLRKKCVVCAQLIEMCNIISIELGCSLSDSGKIIERLKGETALKSLGFLQSFDFELIDIKTPLDAQDNERLNLLFSELGKTDCDTMLNLTEAFRLNMCESKKRYDEYYKTHSRLYIALGFLSGIGVSLVLM